MEGEAKDFAVPPMVQVFVLPPMPRLQSLMRYSLQVIVDVFADTFCAWLQSPFSLLCPLTIEFEKLPLEAIETSFRYTGPRHLMDKFPFALGMKSNHPRLSFPRDSLFLISALVMTRLWLEM